MLVYHSKTFCLVDTEPQSKLVTRTLESEVLGRASSTGFNAVHAYTHTKHTNTRRRVFLYNYVHMTEIRGGFPASKQ